MTEIDHGFQRTNPLIGTFFHRNDKPCGLGDHSAIQRSNSLCLKWRSKEWNDVCQIDRIFNFHRKQGYDMKTTIRIAACITLVISFAASSAHAQQGATGSAALQTSSAARPSINTPARVPFETTTPQVDSGGCDSCDSGGCSSCTTGCGRGLISGRMAGLSWLNFGAFRGRSSGCSDSGCSAGGCSSGGCGNAACCGTGLSGGLSGFGSNGCRRSSGCCGNGGCDSGSGGCSGAGGGRGFGLMGLLGNQCCGTTPCSPCCGVYQSVFGGFSAPHNVNTDIAPDFDIDLRSGWLVGRAIGRQLNCCWRAEIETSYRNNSVARIVDGGVPGADIGGRANVTSGMLNIVRDFAPRGACNDIRPYAGIGGGVAYIDFEADDPVTGFYDVRRTTAAYQLFFGASKRVRQCVDVYGEYRFFGTDDFCVGVTDPNQVTGTIEANMAQHNFLFGVRLWTR